jgi:DNA-binding transcriptional ArsR family regulator
MSYIHSLAALADPTRRRLYDRLRRRAHTVGELARLASVSQPAVSQHLKILKRARLVSVRPEGARRYYQASPEGLAELRTWLDSMWDGVLAAYARGPTP